MHYEKENSLIRLRSLCSYLLLVSKGQVSAKEIEKKTSCVYADYV